MISIAKKFNRTTLILIGIILLGFALRTYKLSHVPSGFFADEASIGYNAYTILTKGKDEYGISFPLFFQAFGEFKNPIEIYSTIPFIALFGLNEFSVRLTSASYGLLSVFAIFLLTKELFKKYKHSSSIALLSSFFLAISPWHVHFSRVPFEGFMPFVLSTTLGLYFFLRAQANIRMLFLSTVSFVLAIYAYFPARIFIPLFGLGIFCVYYNFFWQHKKETVLNFILVLLFLMPLIGHSLSPSGLSRWQQVNIFTHPPNNEAEFQHILNNYISHFSLDFLFLKGDIDMSGQFITRHSVRGMGELYLFQLPLIVLGFLYLMRKKEIKTFSILILWLILYPLGSIFTIDKSAQATRSIIGVVPFQIITAVGLRYAISLFFKTRKFIYYSFMGIVGIIFIFSFLNYLKLYFVKYPLYSSDFWGWQYGARDIVKYFISQQSKYDELIMSPEFNEPEIFFKFYEPNNCIKCRIGLPDVNYNPLIKQLFAVTPTYLSNRHPFIKFKTEKTIYYPNGTIAFEIGEIVK